MVMSSLEKEMLVIEEELKHINVQKYTKTDKGMKEHRKSDISNNENNTNTLKIRKSNRSPKN